MGTDDPEELQEHLKRASKIVRSWPKWKQGILEGAMRPMRNSPREVVDNRKVKQKGATMGTLRDFEHLALMLYMMLQSLYQTNPDAVKDGIRLQELKTVQESLPKDRVQSVAIAQLIRQFLDIVAE